MSSQEVLSFYEELEVRKSASTNEIRESYKKLALRFHPDRNPSETVESGERFKRISRAYKVLSDPKQRQMYDFNPSSFHTAEGDGSPNYGFPQYPGFQPMGFDFPMGSHGFFSFNPGVFHSMHQRTHWPTQNHVDIFDLLFSSNIPSATQRTEATSDSTTNAEFVQRLFIFVSFFCLTSGIGTELILSGLHIIIVFALLIFIASILRKKVFP
ncbi:DnaJ domain containing protein [Perkinsela sp. CCAP 1560/4]|nr:DnaJ domain containing protein [Perkinsela sp. CCAP 1560/4]|eukprot:KNH04205.1 DnaJ domain containing protein [Perkinsela sp. CCAP 1560/4]